MSANLETALEVIKQLSKVQSCKIVFDLLEVEIDKDNILDVLSELKDGDHYQFSTLSSACSQSLVLHFLLRKPPTPGLRTGESLCMEL